MVTNSFDVAILGGGPGGYVAAIRASKLGLKVAVVEKYHLGGVCLNWGCIPTKALYHIATSLEEIKKASTLGIKMSSPKLDFGKTMSRKNDIVEIQRRGLVFHFKKNNIELLNGTGKLISPDTIEVEAGDGKVLIKAEKLIVATGSKASSVPPFTLDNHGILDSKGLLSLDKIPGPLLIVGGGVVGSEFANIFSTFGTKVTIVEILPRILSTEDEEISQVIFKTFRSKGIEVYTKTRVEKVKAKTSGYIMKLSNGKTVEAEKVLISVGRKPNSSYIGLDKIGVEADSSGYIKVDSNLKTSIDNIYAVGDVIGGFQLAHVASEGGKIAAENIAGKSKTISYKVIPWSVFTSPEVGTVGLNKDQATCKGYKVCIGKFPFSSSGKAYITGETTRFVKIVTDKETGEILGAQIIGSRASELVHEIAVAMKGELVIDDLANTVHSHPTLSEAVMEAAEDCFGIATHKS